MLSDIKNISISNYSFTRELYLTLHSENNSLLSKFDKIVTLQRYLFNLNYGTLEQVGYFLIETIKTNETKHIEIKNKDDLLEYVLYKMLNINVTYNINLDRWLKFINDKNNGVSQEMKYMLNVTSENISNFNLIHTMEIMDKFYLPDRHDVLTSIVKNLVDYYNRQISTFFNHDYYFYLIGDVSSLDDYLIEEFNKVINIEHSLDDFSIFDNKLFVRNNFVSVFIESLNIKTSNEIESFISSIERTTSNKIYQQILSLSEMIASSKNSKLIYEFQNFLKNIKHSI